MNVNRVQRFNKAIPADPSRIHILLVGADDLAWLNLPSRIAEYVGIDETGRHVVTAQFIVPMGVGTVDGPIAAELFLFGTILRQEFEPRRYRTGERIVIEWPLEMRGTQDDGPATVVELERQ